LIIPVLRLVIEHEQVRVPAISRMEVRRVDHGRHDLGVGQGLQRPVSDVHRMLYRSVPVGVLVHDGRQYFGQMVPANKTRKLYDSVLYRGPVAVAANAHLYVFLT